MSKRYTDREMRVLEKLSIACRDVERLYGEYHDGELPTTLTQRVGEHIQRCSCCAEFETTYRLTIDLARELGEACGARRLPETPSETIDDGVRARLRAALRAQGIPVS